MMEEFIMTVAEYVERLASVQAGMRVDGLDVLVSEDSGDWLPPTGDARYLTGFTLTNLVGAIRGVVLVVPAEGEPVLVVPPGPQGDFADWARYTAVGARVVEASTVAGGVADTVRSLRLRTPRVGLAHLFSLEQAVHAALPETSVVSARDVDASGSGRDPLERARATKSPNEIAALAAAQRAAEAGMVAFQGAIAPGRRHLLAQSAARVAAVEAGADDGLVIMNAGTDPWMWWHYQGNRAFPASGIVTLEVNARVGGYCAQLARTGTIGKPEGVQRTILDAGLAGVEAMVGALRPGATGHDIWRVGEAALRAHGLAQWGRLGHGMGLAMDEGVAIVEGDETPLEIGSVLAVHACPWDADSRQSGLVGEQYVIGPEGPEVLSTATPSRVFELSMKREGIRP